MNGNGNGGGIVLATAAEANKVAEINQIVGRLRTIQLERELSDVQLRKEYPDIGSTKTWRNRLLSGDLSELNIDRTLLRLRRVAAILDGGSPDEVYYPEMPFAQEMLLRLNRLENQTNDRRILVCLAPNGTGKSAFARWAVAQSRGTRSYIRMRPTWRNKKAHICAGMCKMLGRPSTSTNVAHLESFAIDALSEGEPRTVFVDQAHEGGVDLMHELRAFVDETPSRFVYLAYPTAYNRVQTGTTDALIEAKAFLGRCLKPPFDLYRAGVAAPDVQYYLRRVAGLKQSLAESVAVNILPVLRAHTNMRLLDDAITEAEASAEATVNKDSLADLIVAKVRSMAGTSTGRISEEVE